MCSCFQFLILSRKITWVELLWDLWANSIWNYFYFHMENCALSRNSNKIHKIYCLDVFINIDILSFVNIDIMIINKVSVKFRHVYGYQKKTMDCRYSLDEFTGWVQTLNRLSVGTFNNVLSFSDEQLQLIQKFFCADYFLHILSA